MLRVLAIVLVSVLAAVAVAAIVWSMTRGHVIFFPLILLFGFPLFGLLRRRNSG